MNTATVTDRDALTATLARAEAAFAREIVDSVGSNASWTTTNLKIKSVRLSCRELRAAVAELGNRETTANIEKARDYCSDLRAVFLELHCTTTLPFHCDEPSCALLRLPRTTCWLDCLNSVVDEQGFLDTPPKCQVEVAPHSAAHANRRAERGFVAVKATVTESRAVPSLQRQTVGYLALVLAYLMYYYVDVELMILSLPTIFFSLVSG